MASNIEIVDLSNFEKIQNFLNDSAYKEILENSENFNTRLCIERRLRMPFLETQTGVAQTHCALFMKKKQRMPGFRDGQIYTYPSTRWRKPKRQYLLNHHHSYRAYQYREPTHHHPSVTSGSSSIRDHFQTENAAIVASDGNSLGAGGDNNDSKDSHVNAEKEWFHEDMHMSHYHHAEDFDEDFESDNDFDESYSSRGKRKRGSRSARKSNTVLEGTPKRGRKGGGSRRRAGGGDGEGGDRRRRGGAATTTAVVAGTVSGTPGAVGGGGGGNNTASVLAASTLEASHSNSVSPIATNDETSQSASAPIGSSVVAANFDKTSNDGSIPSNDAGSALNSNAPNNGNGNSSGSGNNSSSFSAATAATVAAASHKKEGAGSGAAGGGGGGAKNKTRNADREVAQPSPYCDFCLGDQRENKKTNLPEELVSCSDCGRSGHPSCLQFTQNMIISVKRYRWQCIECKYCSICGTSDNDDQLLFCDDCDRGYHMYCLSPPLITPPEGSWSCKLCIDEFHGENN